MAKALLLYLLAFTGFPPYLVAQQSNATSTEDMVMHRVVLTANTADIQTHAFYDQLQAHFSSSAIPFSLLINGDLVDNNLSAFTAQTDSANIRGLIQMILSFSQGRTIILPGDRDWSHSKRGGFKNVEKLEKMIESFKLDNVMWAIDKGCPGPKAFTLHHNLLLVTINTQWWNHPFDKPQPADATCHISTEDDFLEELQDILDENEDKNILLAGHFPLVSMGEYGGSMSLKKHLFPLTDFNKRLYIPLPIIGNMYAAYRTHIGTSKDIINGKFNSFRHKLQALVSGYNNLIYLSGHEHNLQILHENTNYFINSGSPDKPAFTPKQVHNDFAKAMPGLIELWFYQSGKVEANIYEWDSTRGITFYAKKSLFQSACNVQDDKLPVNHAYVPCVTEKTVSTEFILQPRIHLATKTLAAGIEYKAGNFKKLMWGRHYRDAWTTTVQVPFLDLDTTYKGLQPYKRGGGRQTKSLQFKAGNGKVYVFRSVNKDPSKALRYELRETILSRVLRDQTTTQHPYGAMAADVMLNEIDVLHVHPKLYVLPDDNKLGPFQKEFAHMLGLLEEKPSVPKKAEKGFGEAEKIVKSYELFRELYNNPHAKVDGKEYARARLFDILVGDWGKHEDNWKWALYKLGDEKLYRPVPRDRDHVFSRWDGLLPWLADRKWAKPSGENFGYTIKDIRSLTWQSRHLDRFLATELTENDWLEAAKSVQESISEEVIEKAIASMPLGKQTYINEQISRKLKARIKDLDKYALPYYQLLATCVDVVGSNEDEYFDVKRNKDGSVKVTLYGNKQALEKRHLFQRTFYPSETKEIRLYGLKGKDVFVVSGESKKSIRLRIIGGPGSDTIQERSVVKSGNKKTFVYEQSTKGEIKLGEEGKKVNHPNPQVYNYNRTAFAYPTYFPSPYISYNQYNGIEFSMGMHFKRQKFGKPDYSVKHQFRASATTRGNFVFHYSSRFHHLIRKWDLELEGIIARPDNYNFFFGEGNETIKDDRLFEKDYYLSRYNRYELGTSLIREFWKKSSFLFRVAYGGYKGIKEPNTFVDKREEDLFGIAPLHMMESALTLDMDFTDNPSLPYKGMRLYVSHQNGIITNANNNNYGITTASIEHYSTLQSKFPVTFGVKAGGADSYGRISFYKMPSLGQMNDLRGYVRHRFTGNGKLFVNSELRLQLLDIKTSIVPMKLGIKGFYDWGRVYVNGEDSKTWHKGYGSGFYMVPLDERFTCSASVAFSKEESPFFLISIGRAFR